MGFIGRDCFSGGGWDLWGEPFGLRRRKFGVGKSGDNFCLERRKSAQISLSPQGAGARKSSSLPNFTLSDVGGLKSSVVGVSTPEKLANATSQNSFWRSCCQYPLPTSGLHHCPAFRFNHPKTSSKSNPSGRCSQDGLNKTNVTVSPSDSIFF